MPRFLQLRWSDEPEDTWRTVREVADGADEAAILSQAERADETARAHYGHTFNAIHRIVDAREATASAARGYKNICDHMQRTRADEAWPIELRFRGLDYDANA